jgi:hypothetical protein
MPQAMDRLLAAPAMSARFPLKNPMAVPRFLNDR